MLIFRPVHAMSSWTVPSSKMVGHTGSIVHEDAASFGVFDTQKMHGQCTGEQLMKLKD